MTGPVTRPRWAVTVNPPTRFELVLATTQLPLKTTNSALVTLTVSDEGVTVTVELATLPSTLRPPPIPVPLTPRAVGLSGPTLMFDERACRLACVEAERVARGIEEDADVVLGLVLG